MKREVTKKQILNFKEYLLDEEKSTATIEKYIRDVMAFLVWMHDASTVKSGGKQEKQKTLLHFADDMRNGHPYFRITVYHGRSNKT